MKRLLLWAVPLCFLVSAGRGWPDHGFRFGAQGLFFLPDKVMTSGTQKFNRFWGLGGELGWIPRRHFELSVELNYAYDDPKGDLSSPSMSPVHKDMTLAAWLIKAAYRLKSRSTPYVGLGYGKGMSAIGYYYGGSSEMDHFNASDAYTIWKPFLGYDYRRYRHLGFRLEGQYQFRDRVYLKGLILLGEAYLAW